jgi:hypothetical protein
MTESRCGLHRCGPGLLCSVGCVCRVRCVSNLLVGPFCIDSADSSAGGGVDCIARNGGVERKAVDNVCSRNDCRVCSSDVVREERMPWYESGSSATWTIVGFEFSRAAISRLSVSLLVFYKILNPLTGRVYDNVWRSEGWLYFISHLEGQPSGAKQKQRGGRHHVL